MIVSINRKDLAPYLWEVLVMFRSGIENSFSPRSVNSLTWEARFVESPLQLSVTHVHLWYGTRQQRLSKLSTKLSRFSEVALFPRMKLRLVWNAPQHLRMVYKVNKVAMEKVAVTDAPVRMVADTTEEYCVCSARET